MRFSTDTGEAKKIIERFLAHDYESVSIILIAKDDSIDSYTNSSHDMAEVLRMVADGLDESAMVN